MIDNDNEIIELKKEINNLIWINAPDTLTLNKAENIAIDIYAMIANGVDITGLQALRIVKA